MDATHLRIIIGDDEPAAAEAIRRAFDAAEIAVEIKTDTQGDIGLLRDITARKQTEDALRGRVEELAALQATVLDIAAQHDLPTLLHTIVERAAQLLGARSGGMYLCDPGRGEVRCVVSYNTPHDYTGTILAYGEGAASPAAIAVENTRLYEEAQTEIAERKRAEAALRESETRFRLLTELVSDYAYELRIRPDGTPRGEWLTESFTSMFGYSLAENQARGGLFSIVLPEDLPIATEHFQRVAAGKADVTEMRFVTRGGETRWLRDYARPVWDDAGQKVTRIFGAAQDITEHKRVEEATTTERSLLRTLVDNLPDSVYVKDLAGRKTLANPADICKMGVASAAEALGKTDFEVFPPDLAAIFDADDQHVIQTGQPVLNREERFILPDGSQGWQLTAKVPLRDRAGQVIGLIGIGHDITERKRAEAERERLLAQVQAQAEQIAQIMDTVPEGVLLLDADGQVLLANPAGVRDLTVLAGAAVGERLTRLGDLPLAELFAAAERDGPWHEIQTGRRIYEAIAQPIVTGEPGAGNPVAGHWVLVINDVTQTRDLRDQLHQQERLAAVGQLAAGIAHDFNNILAIIALHVPLVARAPGLTERERERLAIISEQTSHAAQLIQQLLDFSRRAVLERRPLDLEPLLKEQVKLLARTLPESIEVTLVCEPGEHVVLADPTRLQQMLMNLAVNARDAMPAGGALRLTLARQATAPRPDLPAGPWVRLQVADSGTGIAPETQAHLFEPFFTTKPRGQGTGLGLAQVHGIVKQHEGEIEVHSAVGQGTIFTIWLPALAEAAPAPVPAPAPAAAAGGDAQLILIVEDNDVLLDAMSDILEMMGYRVIGAGNGVEALAVLATRGDTIALVLSDLMMPVMGGEALLRAMRARGLTMPVVILSGYPLEGELVGLKTQGLAGWLLKPPDLDELTRLLAQALESTAPRMAG